MNWLVLAGFLFVISFLIWILRARKPGIRGERARNLHFQHLAKEIGFHFVTDDYFVQLEGIRNDRKIIIYPHNFEGPGFVTLIYLETNMPAIDRNWIEPNLSLGRALVEWKRKISYGYEVTGNQLAKKGLLDALHAIKNTYPYAAVTLPWRFSYSPLLQKALRLWKNYSVFLAMDAGRHPARNEVEQAIRDAEMLAVAAAQSETFSDTTG